MTGLRLRVCVLVLIRSWISKFHKWNSLFYSISVFKMIRVASCDSGRVAWLHTALALVAAPVGSREQSDALLSNHAGELGEILIWCMTQLNMSAGACHHLLRSLLPLHVHGVMYRATYRCCAAHGRLRRGEPSATTQGTFMPIHHPDDAPACFQPWSSLGMSQPPLCAAGKHRGFIASWSWMWYLKETCEFPHKIQGTEEKEPDSWRSWLCKESRLSFRSH